MYDFPHESRIWIYQASRNLTDHEIKIAGNFLEPFCTAWTAHNQALKAGFRILYHRFIILIVDETRTDASGCSIDKSVRALKDLSGSLGIDLFNRMQMAYLDGGQVKIIPYEQVGESYNRGKISGDTLFFNLNLATFGELETQFLVPLREHWLSKTIRG